MTGRLKSMDEENEIESDWKFAAMVIDRSVFSHWQASSQFLVLSNHIYR